MLPRTSTRTSEGPRVLLVTGASSGIGRSIALQAATRGDHLVLAARARDPLEEVARACEVRGAASAFVVPTDVGDDRSVVALISRSVAEHGRLDAVAHCAGVFSLGEVDVLPPDVFDGVIRTNLTGSVNVSRHALRQMREQGQGSLLLMGSVLGHTAVGTITPYVVSKWGVRALARQLQLENRDRPDVHVSHLAPGVVDTPIWEQGANHTGIPVRPAPPSSAPEKLARVALDILDRPRHRTQSGPINNVLRFGFSFLPPVYDALVGPAFRLLLLDQDQKQEPTDGNVLAPRPERARLHGADQAPARRVARQLRDPLELVNRLAGRGTRERSR